MTQKEVTRTPAGEALSEVIVETTHTFFRLRAAGARFGAVTTWGGSTLGLLRTLSARGPCTVPQIARMRPVARQHIQKLANELVKEGLVEFIDNPAHRRSRLLRLTEKGEQRFEELQGQFIGLTEELARGMDEELLRTTAEGLRCLREKLESL